MVDLIMTEIDMEDLIDMNLDQVVTRDRIRELTELLNESKDQSEKDRKEKDLERLHLENPGSDRRKQTEQRDQNESKNQRNPNVQSESNELKKIQDKFLQRIVMYLVISNVNLENKDLENHEEIKKKKRNEEDLLQL